MTITQRHQPPTITEVLLMTKLLLVTFLATASALKVAGGPVVPQPAVKPSSMSTALQLRGGGMVDQGVWLKAASAFFGLYGVGFLLAPEMTITQNFVVTPDKYHSFFARNIGLCILYTVYLLNYKMDVAAAVPALVAYMAICAVVGPVYAELKLETTPAHKAALLMVPFIVTGLLAL
mmetsp:Transcript_12080/g.39797  ORF Transcript_12080/g.39797 Transcript_12080/m.39797 type:complete len:177 (-) Transcript_12080:217-747(-)